ncbi:MAG: hypothetical protein ACFUZC_00540 [Chthoniobacteraceae bacterium]
MHYSSRFTLPMDENSSSSGLNSMSAPSNGFVQCPVALLAGLSKEQLNEIARVYERAWKQAHRAARPQRRFNFPFDGNFDNIGLN